MQKFIQFYFIEIRRVDGIVRDLSLNNATDTVLKNTQFKTRVKKYRSRTHESFTTGNSHCSQRQILIIPYAKKYCTKILQGSTKCVNGSGCLQKKTINIFTLFIVAGDSKPNYVFIMVVTNTKMWLQFYIPLFYNQMP